MQKRDIYKNILSDIVKEHMVLFDPQVALSIIRSVPSISLSADGTVHAIKGNQKEVFIKAEDAYIAFGGDISRNTIATIVAAYPELS